MSDKMREALIAARTMIVADRDALIDCHTGPNGIDEAGHEAADEYDAVLRQIGAALAQAEQRGEVVAWGMPNTAITGKKMALMMVRLDIPSDDQYGGAMWVPLYTAPAPAVPEDSARDAARYRWLRDSNRVPSDSTDGHIVVCDESGEDVLWGSALDRSIDSAMLADAPAVDATGKSGRSNRRFLKPDWIEAEDAAGGVMAAGALAAPTAPPAPVVPDRWKQPTFTTLAGAPTVAAPDGWILAMRQLVYYARTSGGTAGPDQTLMEACEACEKLLAAAPEGPR